MGKVDANYSCYIHMAYNFNSIGGYMKKEWKLSICPVCGSRRLYRKSYAMPKEYPEFSCYPNSHKFEKVKVITVVRKK